MKQVILIIGFIFVILFSNCKQQSEFPALSSFFLGQKPPGMTPELFAPGILSTEANEFNATFTLSGETANASNNALSALFNSFNLK